MSGYKEIYPTDQAYYWKQEELIVTKLRLLGGGSDRSYYNWIKNQENEFNETNTNPRY